MMAGSQDLPTLAFEVPLSCLEQPPTIPTITVGDHGAAATSQQFAIGGGTAAKDCVGCTLNANIYNPISLSSIQNESKVVLWELHPDRPSTLSLANFSVEDSEQYEDAVHLQFPAPLLPSITSAPTMDGNRIFAVTADGSLTIINTTHTFSNAAASRQPLSVALSARGSITVVPLAPFFERLGAPVTLLHVADLVCIGTALGSVVCVPVDSPVPEAAFELTPGPGLLGSLIGGFFARGKESPIEQMVELQFMDRALLCTLHAGAVLRMWDLEARKLLHVGEMMPRGQADDLRMTLARVAVDPLDATCSFLLLFFEPIDSSATTSGYLCTFELILEDRGSAMKVSVQGGPRLARGVHRMVDMAIQHTREHSMAVWMLHEDGHGKRTLDCVPLAFTDAMTNAAVEVQLIEDQLQTASPSQPGHLQAMCGLAAALAEATGTQDDDAAIERKDGGLGAMAGFADAILAPGRLSRLALQDALAALRWPIPQEHQVDVLAADLPALQACLLSAVAAGSAQDPNGAPGAWAEVFDAYSTAMRGIYTPRGLVQLTTNQIGDQGLVLIRSGLRLSMVRGGSEAELVAGGSWPRDWNEGLIRRDIDSVRCVLRAASSVIELCGGMPALTLLRTAMHSGMDLRSKLLPTVGQFLMTGGGAGATDEWRAARRRLPLILAPLCTSASETGFTRALEMLVSLLSRHLVPLKGNPIRSPLFRFSRPLVAAALTHAHQVAAALCDCLLGVSLLGHYVVRSHTLGIWRVSDAERRFMRGPLADRTEDMMAIAGVAFWATSTPLLAAADVGEGDPHHATEDAPVVVSLLGGGDTAQKRARLMPRGGDTVASRSRYPAEDLLTKFHSQINAHVVRNITDLQRVAASFARWLLGVKDEFSARARDEHNISAPEQALVPGPASVMALVRIWRLLPSLVRSRDSVGLTRLHALVARQWADDDVRLLFLQACAKAMALQDPTIGPLSPHRRRRLEDESVALFLRVAAMYSNRKYYFRQLEGVAAGLEALKSCSGGETTAQPVISPRGSSDPVQAAAEELNYHETLMGVYDRLGCPSVASRFAMAAAQHVDNALPGDEMGGERVRRAGWLWSFAFTFCLQAGEYEAAYAALLGNEDAEMQVDCLRRLVNELAAKGEVATLCALPYAHSSLLVSASGRPGWVSLLEEATRALRRRAAMADLEEVPQPYKVLFDFQVARGNFQGAAAAMLEYARRLTAETPDTDKEASREAHRALTSAVGTLSLVDPEQAWLEDPIASSPKVPKTKRAAGGGEEEYPPPPLVTLQDLRRELAVAAARAAVAAVLPSDTRIGGADSVLLQLLTLGLHDEAVSLVEAAFVGTKQHRLREKVVYDLAQMAAKLQLQVLAGGVAAMGGGTTDGNDDEMLMEDGEAGNGAMLEDIADGASIGDSSSKAAAAAAAAACAWQRLRGHLEAFEEIAPAGYHLRVVAVEALLAEHPKLCPPPWLLAPFFPPPSGALADAASSANADVSSLLRAYMKHGREEDAGRMAVRALARLVHSVPSVALPRPAAVCLPHALLEELLGRLPASSPVHGALRKSLAKVTAAAERQTGIIADIYAA